MFIFFVFFFTCVPSHLPFWRRATDRAQKSCARQFPWQYHAVAWEETKCISQYRDNVTESVIRAFKLAAHPKHCQILCERGNILTALSPLILCVWEKKKCKKWFAWYRREKIQGFSQHCWQILCLSSPSLVAAMMPLYCIFFLSAFCRTSFFFNAYSVLLYPSLLFPSLAGTDAGIFELIGANTKQKRDN